MFASGKVDGGYARDGKKTRAREWFPITVGSVLLAIDPSICNCGYAVMKKTSGDPELIVSGVLRPQSGAVSRYDNLAQLIQMIAKENACTDAVIETPGGGQRHSATQLMVYAQAVGICGTACYLAGLNTNRVTVTEWKGRDSKRRTMTWVRALTGVLATDDNLIDAIGLGCWFCWRKV